MRSVAIGILSVLTFTSSVGCLPEQEVSSPVVVEFDTGDRSDSTTTIKSFSNSDLNTGDINIGFGEETVVSFPAVSWSVPIRMGKTSEALTAYDDGSQPVTEAGEESEEKPSGFAVSMTPLGSSPRTFESDFEEWLFLQGKLEECPLGEVPCEIDPETYLEQQPTLEQLINFFFKPEDREKMLRIAFCESSAKPVDKFSEKINPESGASGWYQHLPKWWEERSEKASFSGFHVLDPIANVGVAAWLYYNMNGNKRWSGGSHWYPSHRCWNTQ